MTYYEKTLLRKWVMDGHNPRENPGSKYLCMTGSEPMNFLDVYRMNRDIQQEMKGKNKVQREAYLKDLMGWTDSDESDDSGFLDLDDPDPDEFFNNLYKLIHGKRCHSTTMCFILPKKKNPRSIFLEFFFNNNQVFYSV